MTIAGDQLMASQSAAPPTPPSPLSFVSINADDERPTSPVHIEFAERPDSPSHLPVSFGVPAPVQTATRSNAKKLAPMFARLGMESSDSDDCEDIRLRADSPPHIPVVLGVAAIGDDTETARRRRASSFSGPDADAVEGTVYFTTPLRAADLVDANDHPVEYEYTVTGRKRRKDPVEGQVRIQLGAKVEVNGKHLAIFRVGAKVYAVDSTCSHAGGDLSEGDIEDVGGRVCVSCPRHHFCFDLETGVSAAPKDRYAQKVYPVRIAPDGVVMVGFARAEPHVFEDTDF